jgi:hypothetical protein
VIPAVFQQTGTVERNMGHGLCEWIMFKTCYPMRSTGDGMRTTGDRMRTTGDRMRTTYSFTKRKTVNSSNMETRVSRQVSDSESDVMALSGS